MAHPQNFFDRTKRLTIENIFPSFNFPSSSKLPFAGVFREANMELFFLAGGSFGRSREVVFHPSLKLCFSERSCLSNQECARENIYKNGKGNIKDKSNQSCAGSRRPSSLHRNFKQEITRQIVFAGNPTNTLLGILFFEKSI